MVSGLDWAYLDSSFVVSLYSLDINSATAVRSLQRSSSIRLITTLGEIETVNAFELRVFRKEISRMDAEQSRKNFELDIRNDILKLRGFPENALVRAQELSRRHTARIGTRTADILHVAAALEYGAATLFSFDMRQRETAKAAGLAVLPK